MNATTKKLKIPTRDFPFSIKQLNEDLGTFEGHCATWDIDLQKDRIPRGAFEKTLRQAKADLAKRDGEFIWPVCWQHNTNEPIGGIYEAYEDSKGLFVRGMLDLDTELGRRAFSALKKKYMDSFSIGYKPTRHHMEAAKGIPGGIRVLDEIHLYEVSVVLFPANPEARVRGVKTAYDAWAESMLNDMKRTAERYGAHKRSNRMTDYGRPAFGAAGNETDLQRAWHEQAGEPRGYRIERGLEEESPAAFERAWRAELREEDDLWLLTDKNRIKELERREQERRQKQATQHEALLKERRERAEACPDMTLDWTPEAFAAKMGLDPVWMSRLFAAYVERGVVEPVDAATLTLHGSDIQRISKKEAEAFEFQAIKARNKRAQGVR